MLALQCLTAAHGQQEGVFLGNVAHGLVAAAGAAVPRAHLRAQQQRCLIAACGTQPRNPLGRFPVLHAHVMVTRGHKQGRVGLGANILVSGNQTHLTYK